MKLAALSKRKVWIGAIVLFWLVAGAAAPLILVLDGDEFRFDNGAVVAAPRDSFQLTETLLLDPGTGTLLSGGRLALAAPKDQNLTAEQAAEQLKRGDGVLLLENTEVLIGDVDRKPAETDVPAPLVQAMQSGKFKALTFRQSAVIVVLPGGYRERLTQADMQLVANGPGRVEVKGTGFWRGQRSKFSLSTAAPLADGTVAVKLRFEATLLDFTYDGTFDVSGRTAAHGSLTLQLKDTERLASALGTSWPIGTSLQSVLISGPLRWEAGTIAFDAAKVSIGGNQGRGTVSLNMVAGQAMISSTLAFDRLDVAPYLPSAVADYRTAAWAWWSKVVGTFSQPNTAHVSADIRLSTAKLLANNIELGPAAATISLKNGKFSADIAEMTLGAGRATGQIAVDFNRYLPKLAVRGRIDDIALEKWSGSLFGQRYVTGKGRLVADLSSQGADLPQILSDLAGRVDFDLPEGGGIRFAVSELNAARDKLVMTDAAKLMQQAATASTAVTNLKTSWVIKEGVANVVAAHADHADGQVKMGGWYDLTRRSYELKILSLQAAEGRPVSAELKEPKLTVGAAVAIDPMQSGVLLSLRSGKAHSGWSQFDDVGALGAQLQWLRGRVGELEQFLSVEKADMARREF